MKFDLFYPLSKFGWFLLAPSHVMLWMTIATAIALSVRRERAARWLAVTTAALFVLLSLSPVGIWLARPLENAYPPPDPPPGRIDGIVTLGGGLDTKLLLARGGAPSSHDGLARLVSTLALARRYPSARIVFSGGAGRFADAVAARLLFAEMGLDPARLTVEAASRNTFENLAYTRRLVRPGPGQTWVLATSALQTPRAMAVARRLGWSMLPWPTDYVTTPRGGLGDFLTEINLSGRLALVDAATHEWLGLLIYRLHGMAGAAR